MRADDPTAGVRSYDGPMTRADLTAFFEHRQEAFDNLDAAALAAGYTSDCRLESPTAGTVEGRSAIERVYQAWFDAFVDMKTHSEPLVVDGERVAQVLNVEGTDIGGFMGLPATGKSCHFSAVCLFEFRGRLIARERRVYDFTGVLVQLGVLKARPLA
jgi:steroid delta-isomerase-like uncharacterized protein